MEWFPPGVDPVEHSALVPGIPPWLVVPLTGWVKILLTDAYGSSNRMDIVQAWHTATRSQTPAVEGYAKKGFEWFWDSLDSDRKIVLVDFLVYWAAERWLNQEVALLESSLHDAGSEWRVGTRQGNAGLEKRVPQGVIDAADAVMDSRATAGALLSEAWHAAFGRNPDPEEARVCVPEVVEADVLGDVEAHSRRGEVAAENSAIVERLVPAGARRVVSATGPKQCVGVAEFGCWRRCARSSLISARFRSGTSRVLRRDFGVPIAQTPLIGW
jgi:hypothetical protein